MSESRLPIASSLSNASPYWRRLSREPLIRDAVTDELGCNHFKRRLRVAIQSENGDGFLLEQQGLCIRKYYLLEISAPNEHTAHVARGRHKIGRREHAVKRRGHISMASNDAALVRDLSIGASRPLYASSSYKCVDNTILDHSPSMILILGVTFLLNVYQGCIASIRINVPASGAILAERVPMQMKIVCKCALSISAAVNAVLLRERLVRLATEITCPPLENGQV